MEHQALRWGQTGAEVKLQPSLKESHDEVADVAFTLLVAKARAGLLPTHFT